MKNYKELLKKFDLKEVLKTKKIFGIGALALAMTVAGSTVAIAHDGDGDNEKDGNEKLGAYSEQLDKQYFKPLEADKAIRDIEMDMSSLNELMVVTIDVEAPKKTTDEYLIEKLQGAVDEVGAQIRSDFNKRIRVSVERNDTVIKSTYVE